MRRFFQGVAHLLMAISPGKGLECIMKTKAKNERQKHSNSFEQEREKLHRAVLTSVSHDLKTPLTFVRFEPFVLPKKSLTGDSTERVDTRVLQVIYRVENDALRLFVGQQMDVFIEAAPVQSVAAR